MVSATVGLGNLLLDRDPFSHLSELRQIAAKLRLQGQRQSDAIAELIERAVGTLMDS